MTIPRKILIVDDDADFISVTKEYLESIGYIVTATHSPHQALEVLSSGTFDLIISDYRMPELSGLALLEKIRGSGMDTPFLLASGLIDSVCEEMVVDRGGAGLLLKPFRLTELKEAVTRALRGG